jgi:hypothetical protein
MTPKESWERWAKYDAVMPKWLKIAYNKEVIVHSIVQKCFYADVPASDLLSRVAEGLLETYKAQQKLVMDYTMKQSTVILKPD